MADTLEDFLIKIRRDLDSLPAEERERRLDVLTDQLAEYIAVRVNQGEDEDAATREAVRQFEAYHQSALYSNLPEAKQARLSLSPVLVTALYCAVSSKIIACAFGFLLWLLASPLYPHVLWVEAVSEGIRATPSLSAAILAGAVLLLRDGFAGIVINLTSPQTVPGTGVRWIVLKHGFLSVLTLLLMLLYRTATTDIAGFATLQQSPVHLLVGLALCLLMPAAFFLAGWLVARASPGAGLSGVRTAAITCGLLSFVDQCWLQFHSGYDLPFGVAAALAAFLLLGQGLLAGLAIAGARIGAEDSNRQP